MKLNGTNYLSELNHTQEIWAGKTGKKIVKKKVKNIEITI